MLGVAFESSFVYIRAVVWHLLCTFFFFEKGGVKTEMIWCIGARGDEAPSLADVRERSCCGFVVLKKMVMWVPRIMKFIASDLVAQK